MPLDPRAKRFLDMTAIAPAAGRPTLATRRGALEKLMQFARADRLSPAGLDGELAAPAAGLRYRLYTPASAPAQTPGVIFFHGGGLVAGSLETHDVICRALAENSGCRLLAIDYRLAPEHRFPAAIEDALAAIAAVAHQSETLGIDETKIAVCGDSAGATLAAIACQHFRHASSPRIALQVLICPVLDFGASSPSRQDFAQGYLIDKATLDADLADYLPDGITRADPQVSPLRAADLAGLPPAIIHTAEFDPMRDEGNAYARKLQAAGVATDLTCHPGMLHNFHALGAVLPQGREVLHTIGTQIRNALAR